MGQRKNVIQLAVPTSIAVGAAVDVSDRLLSLATMVVLGTFAQTLRLEASIDGGTNFTADWIDSRGLAIANITAVGNILLGGDATHIRIRCTAYTSGQAIIGVMFAPQYARADRLSA